MSRGTTPGPRPCTRSANCSSIRGSPSRAGAMWTRRGVTRVAEIPITTSQDSRRPRRHASSIRAACSTMALREKALTAEASSGTWN